MLKTNRLFLVVLFLFIITSCQGTENNLKNRSPVIESLTLDKTEIFVNDVVILTCNASDPDNDKLTYTWTTTGGSIQKLSNEPWKAQFTATTSGNYTVTVSTDGKDIASRQIVLEVKPKTQSNPPANNPPRYKEGIGKIPDVEISQGEKALFDFKDYIEDPDGDDVTFSIISGQGTINGSKYEWQTSFETEAKEYIVKFEAKDAKKCITPRKFQNNVEGRYKQSTNY